MARLCGESREFYVGDAAIGPVYQRLECQQDLDDIDASSHDTHWMLRRFSKDITAYYEWPLPRPGAATSEGQAD